MGAKLLQDVRQDLADVVQVCEGKKKQTNYLRTLINELVKGILPRSWSHYTVPAGMTVIQWVSDFSERIKQLQNISQAAASGGAKELKVVAAVPEKPGGGWQLPWVWGQQLGRQAEARV